MKEFTLGQLNTISHTLGVDLHGAVLSLKKKDKELVEPFYRNYFNTTDGSPYYIHKILPLIEMGAMERFRDDYFGVTEEGIKQFKRQFYEMAIYKPSKQQDIEYLKFRINWYCEFYNYKFGEVNSDHIIEEFKEKFYKHEYMSHTTKDVVGRFKSELKKHFKNGSNNNDSD